MTLQIKKKQKNCSFAHNFAFLFNENLFSFLRKVFILILQDINNIVLSLSEINSRYINQEKSDNNNFHNRPLL